jgi:hypothetical protein
MNEIQFAPAQMSHVLTLASYKSSLLSPIDSFLEDHIAQSVFYRIVIEGVDAGHFAIHGSTLLTQFHLVGMHRRRGSPLLAQIKRDFSIRAAFVPTCDEFFLSHAIENYAQLEKQACFFVEADGVWPAVNEAVRYRPAQVSDAETIESMCGDFLDRYGERIAGGQLHVGHMGDELVALGVIERSTMFPGQASIGMFTRESRRQQAIGTSTIVHMRRVCHAEGLRPIAGCWYYNHASRKTLEAAGMTTPTRLLRFAFEAKTE